MTPKIDIDEIELEKKIQQYHDIAMDRQKTQMELPEGHGVIRVKFQIETRLKEEISATVLAMCAEIRRLRELANWQNMPNRNPAGRGGYEFYVNEEWTGIAEAAIDVDPGWRAALRKTRMDPDDERVRVRRVKDDDGLMNDLNDAQEEIRRLRTEAAMPDGTLWAAYAREQAEQISELAAQLDCERVKAELIEIAQEENARLRAVAEAARTFAERNKPIISTRLNTALAALDAAKKEDGGLLHDTVHVDPAGGRPAKMLEQMRKSMGSEHDK